MFWDSFNMGALSLSHTVGGGGKKVFTLKKKGGGAKS